YDLAGEEIGKVEKVQAQLTQLGHAAPDAPTLLAKARQYVTEAKAAGDRGDYKQTYLDSRRALRPLRILMREQWEAAVKSMGDGAAGQPGARRRRRGDRQADPGVAGRGAPVRQRRRRAARRAPDGADERLAEVRALPAGAGVGGGGGEGGADGLRHRVLR